MKKVMPTNFTVSAKLTIAQDIELHQEAIEPTIDWLSIKYGVMRRGVTIDMVLSVYLEVQSLLSTRSSNCF